MNVYHKLVTDSPEEVENYISYLTNHVRHLEVKLNNIDHKYKQLIRSGSEILNFINSEKCYIHFQMHLDHVKLLKHIRTKVPQNKHTLIVDLNKSITTYQGCCHKYYDTEIKQFLRLRNEIAAIIQCGVSISHYISENKNILTRLSTMIETLDVQTEHYHSLVYQLGDVICRIETTLDDFMFNLVEFSADLVKINHTCFMIYKEQK